MTIPVTHDAVETVKRGFELWSRGQVEPLLDLMDPDVEWTVRPGFPEAGVYRGRQELRRFFTRFEEVLDDQWAEPQEFIEAGDHTVVVSLHWGGRGKLSGVEIAERQGETCVVPSRTGRSPG